MFHHKYTEVYVLTYLPTGKKYVGKTTNMEYRFQQHVSSLRNGHHNSRELQQDYDQYGGDKKAFLIETVGRRKGNSGRTGSDLEIATMIALRTYDEIYGYNTHDCAMQKIRKAENLFPIYLFGRCSRKAKLAKSEQKEMDE